MLCAILSAIASSKPNVLVILTDDVGWGDVGYNCKNATVCPRTPNIDALATGPHAVLFRRFYAGAGVCSPTRSSVLTGRNNYRSCIASALACDHMDTGAAKCSQGSGLSHSEFTVAKAATKAGMSSIHIGKWHMGDLWKKGLTKANPVSSPTNAGFTHWMTSQSQLPTSTPNCGCFPLNNWSAPQPPPDFGRSTEGLKFKHDWPGENCIVAGGFYVNESMVCSTYWYPDAAMETGVKAISKKIPGDDGQHVVDTLEQFVGDNVKNATSWLAVLMLHYIHLPHPAMPKYFAAYDNDPDYVGTLQQLDDNVGAIVDTLKSFQVYENTLLFFTSDNGPHCSETSASWPEVHCAGIAHGRSTGGQGSWGESLRGCKASNWEGGIRVPGFMVWPSMIKKNIETWYPAVTHDFLPTILEAIGVTSDRPTEALDGISLMPFVRAAAGTDDAPLPPAQRTTPIGFWWADAKAWVEGEMKIVGGSISAGQGCVTEPPYVGMPKSKGPFLFNLTADQSESHDLSKSMPGLFEAMTARFTTWQRSVVKSSTGNHCDSHPKPPIAALTDE